MTESVIFWAGLYLGLGAMLGLSHLLRCKGCASRFGSTGERVAYIILAAFLEIPLRFWVMVRISFEGCEETE
jgi:hypothetical protein